MAAKGYLEEKMDRKILILTLLPLSVFCFDIYDFFSIPSPKSLVNHHHRSNGTNLNQTFPAKLNDSEIASLNQTQIANWSPMQLATLNQTQLSSFNLTLNDTLLVRFSSQCSYSGTAISIRVMLEDNYPGINVTLSEHPPVLLRYLTTKLITTAQVFTIMIGMAGKHILRYMRMPVPSWFHRLTEHRIAAIGIPWLLGSIAINYLQNIEDFDVFFNGELAFSKQVMGRFPKGPEIKEIIRSHLGS